MYIFMRALVNTQRFFDKLERLASSTLHQFAPKSLCHFAMPTLIGLLSLKAQHLVKAPQCLAPLLCTTLM